MRKDTALYLLLIGAFASLFLDIRYEHRDVLYEMWQGYIPLVASGVAILASVLAFSSRQATVRASAALFLLVACVGLVGLYYHTHFAPFMFLRYLTTVDTQTIPDAREMLKRPTFAPLAFTGLGSVGFIVVWPGFRWPK